MATDVKVREESVQYHIPVYRRQADDEYLRTPRPGWYVEHTRRKPVELSLDLNRIYSLPEFWEGISLVDRDPGMPALHRHWCLNLIDTFIPSLTSVNLEKCNVGDRGLEELAIVLRTNTTLRYLNIKDSNISSRQTQLFLDTLEAFNFTLTTMELDEGKKTAFAKNKMQHESLTLVAVAGEIMASENEVDEFQNLKKRATRITAFNTRACKVRTLHSLIPSSRALPIPPSMSIRCHFHLFLGQFHYTRISIACEREERKQVSALESILHETYGLHFLARITFTTPI